MDAQLTTGYQLERVCRKYRQLRRNVEGANPKQDDLDRYLRRRDLDNGMVSIEAVCHPEEAALIWAAIEQATKEVYAARQAEARVASNAATDSNADVSAETREGVTSDGACDVPEDVSAETRDGATSDGACDVPEDVSEETCSGAAGETAEAFGGEEAFDTASECDAADVYEDDCAFFEKFGVCPEPQSEPVSRARDDDRSGVMPDDRGHARSVTTPASNATSRARESLPARPTFNRLDGLLALMRSYATGQSSKTPVEIVVAVSAEALANRAAPDERIAFVDDEGCIGAETARRLSCDAGIVCLIEDEHGNPLSVGRRTRSIPTSIGRALH